MKSNGIKKPHHECYIAKYLDERDNQASWKIVVRGQRYRRVTWIWRRRWQPDISSTVVVVKGLGATSRFRKRGPSLMTVVKLLKSWRRTVSMSEHRVLESRGWLVEIAMGGLMVKTMYMIIDKRDPSNKGWFCNNSEIYTLISKRLYVENKAKLSQLTRTDFAATIAKLTH